MVSDLTLLHHVNKLFPSLVAQSKKDEKSDLRQGSSSSQQIPLL
jgi:hypothetical protein